MTTPAMSGFSTTLDPDLQRCDPDRAPVPGVVAVFCGDAPICRPLPLVQDALELGRGVHPELPDDRVASRRHARVLRRGDQWRIVDCESRNGTFVDGERVTGELTVAQPRVIRVGRTLFLPVDDIRRYQDGVVVTPDAVIGPVLNTALTRIRRLAATTEILLIAGESGVGKELAARTYHEAQPPPSGPFLAVNCAAIPEGVAERLLFGSLRGAFSGAVDAKGYLELAEGGVLFLDEVAELERSVQAKLLRVLEAREVFPLGAARPRAVSARMCFATLTDLDRAVADGAFRADLYFRIARATVRIPPLRERLEEIPFLIARELASVARNLRPHVELVQACLLRAWPGNLRELLAAARRAGEDALAEGEVVRASHLDASVGTRGAPTTSPPARRSSHPEDIAPDAIRAAIAEHRGNLSAVARALGLHRSQLYRLLERHAIAHG